MDPAFDAFIQRVVGVQRDNFPIFDSPSREMLQGTCYVTPVSYHMDELSQWEMLEDVVEMKNVLGSLLAPTKFPLRFTDVFKENFNEFGDASAFIDESIDLISWNIKGLR
jgi:hypothetical protein